MVLFHLIRCQRYLVRGLRDRARVSKMIYGAAPLPPDSPTAVVPSRTVRTVAVKMTQEAANATDSAARGTCVRGVVWPWYRKLPHDPAFGYFLAQPITVPVYCGLRMVDELGHVNNAKYLEISEFARWHQLSFLGIGHVMNAHKIAFVVSDLSITYQREIAPCKTVWVRTRFILPAEIAPAASATHTGTMTVPAVADKKRFFIEHELWSADGQKLHAALTLAAALIGPVGYEQELVERYGTEEEKKAYAAAHAKPARPRATLNCEHVLADVAGLATTAEVRQLFAHVDHVCTSVGEAMDGTTTAAAAAGGGGTQTENSEDKERADRISMLAHVWKASRNTLRQKSLMPKARTDKKD